MNVLLIGAGALGSRHLQSLASHKDIQAVTVVEPSEGARETAIRRWAEVPSHAGKTLSFDAMDMLAGSFDAAVVATPSPGRLELLEQVLKLGVRNILCEKVLFQSVRDLDRAVALVTAHGADVRVNHIYRYAPPFPDFAELGRAGNLSLNVEVGGDGMGCNLIHYLDLFEYLAGEPVSALEVSLARPAHASKRGPAFLEFEGDARGRSAGGQSVVVTYKTGSEVAPRMDVRVGDMNIRINEGDGTIGSSLSDFAARRFDSPRVSALTGQILDDQRSGRCRLPTIAETAGVNRLMLEQFNLQLHGRHDDDLLCPIT